MLHVTIQDSQGRFGQPRFVALCQGQALPLLAQWAHAPPPGLSAETVQWASTALAALPVLSEEHVGQDLSQFDLPQFRAAGSKGQASASRYSRLAVRGYVHVPTLFVQHAHTASLPVQGDRADQWGWFGLRTLMDGLEPWTRVCDALEQHGQLTHQPWAQDPTWRQEVRALLRHAPSWTITPLDAQVQSQAQLHYVYFLGQRDQPGGFLGTTGKLGGLASARPFASAGAAHRARCEHASRKGRGVVVAGRVDIQGLGPNETLDWSTPETQGLAEILAHAQARAMAQAVAQAVAEPLPDLNAPRPRRPRL